MNYDHVKACMAKGKRPKGMGYGDYSHLMKANEEEPMSQEDYEDMDEDEEEDMEGEGRKSMIDADDLMKAIDDYAAVEDSLESSFGTRQEQLEAKADAGTITKSERVELGKLWAAEDDDEPEHISKSIRDRVIEDDDDDDEDMEGLFDATPVFDRFAKSIDDALNDMMKSISGESRATRQLMKAQGQLLKGIGQVIAGQNDLIEELADRLDAVETTPQTPRAITARSAGRPRPLNKSTTAGEGGGDSLTKAQVFEGMRKLIIKAEARGDQNALERYTRNSAKLETVGEIDRDVLAEVESEMSAA